MNQWLGVMGIDNGGKSYRLIRDQSRRLSLCRLTFYRVTDQPACMQLSLTSCVAMTFAVDVLFLGSCPALLDSSAKFSSLAQQSWQSRTLFEHLVLPSCASIVPFLVFALPNTDGF